MRRVILLGLIVMLGAMGAMGAGMSTSGAVRQPLGITRDAEATTVADAPRPPTVALTPHPPQPTATPPPTSPQRTAPSPPTPAAPPPSTRDEVTVLAVLTGDTIQVRHDGGAVAIVRYLGIVTPRIQPDHSSGQCFGLDAFERNRALVEGKTVYLERDPAARDVDQDAPRYVWVVGADDGWRMANQELIRWGFATVASTDTSFRYRALFAAEENRARELKRGRWATCG